ncbi:Hpt domain-containing protein [Pseudomonas sp. GD03842]|uniref:Hpt domain-containing protein n=1 Tax=unclassified Pseudomonas TaxID=196821 RepID=UPI000D396616|nr:MULTISPECIES: Hpt domain-containing protein [unclassified Pseudomonas]MDH0749181.1 Hpt domain-containing protein [Pseudomonas sp. GD03842]RAU40699.1 Hpt domain-containing protein [Pseudomonas sp. RIT 409]RAU47795.1 Hpt domain-containing protein [Pseudomonas sp. RIT 412]
MESHVDLGVLGTLRDVMEGEYPALLDVFIKDSEQRVGDLNRLILGPGFSASSAAQMEQVGMMAHSFKGSCSNMGAVDLAQLCHQLEDVSRSPIVASDGQIRQLLNAIEIEYSVVRGLFDAELQSVRVRR